MAQPSTSQRIADAALAILENEGAAAVSMRRVADAIGLSPMAIYRHFPNRDALLKNVSERSFRQLTEYWTKHTSRGDLEARLIGTQIAYLEYALAHPHVFDYIFAEPRDNARRFPADFRDRASPTFTMIVDLLEQGMEKGLFRREDSLEAGMTIWAESHGLVSLFRAGRFSYDETEFRAFYRRSLERLLNGLKA